MLSLTQQKYENPQLNLEELLKRFEVVRSQVHILLLTAVNLEGNPTYWGNKRAILAPVNFGG